MKKLTITLFVLLMSCNLMQAQTNYALEFDGDDDFVLVPHDAQLNMNSEFTLEAWINANEWKPQAWAGTIIGKDGDGDSGSSGYVLRCGNDGIAQLVIGNGGWPEVGSQPVMVEGVWYHLAGVYTGTELKIYINGALQNTVSSGDPITPSDFDLRIGESGDFTGRVFDGKIDEVRIWDHAKDAQEIADNMTTEYTGSETGLVAYYTFDEGSGSSVSDLTPNGHDGTLTNMDAANCWVNGYELYSNDIGVRTILKPYSGPEWNSHEIVEVSVMNYAFDEPTSFDVSYQVNDGEIYTETVNNPLAAFESLSYNFTRVANLLDEDTVKITAFTSLPGDNDPSNDTAEMYIYRSNTITPFYQVQHDFGSNGQSHSKKFYLPEDNSAYESILMHVTLDCPATGCDPWDQPAKITLIKDGESYEIGRYITPYRVACGPWTIDVTDFRSLLKGEVEINSYVQVWGASGWLVTIEFEYNEGTPDYPYSKIDKLWNTDYLIYGDTAYSYDLPVKSMAIEENAEDARIRLTTSGHGQGNTDNAAEFSHFIHHIWVDGSETFEQDLWKDDCEDNPCSPQYGTWEYDRAGWCPGQQVIPNHYELGDYITPGSNIDLDYVLYEYINYLNTGYNGSSHTEPHYRIHSYLVSESNERLADFYDIGINSVILPDPVLVEDAQLSVEIENFGTQTVNEFQLAYYYQDEEIYSEEISQSIAAGETITHQLSNTYDFSDATLDDIFTVVVFMENDEMSKNDAMNLTLSGSQVSVEKVLNEPGFMLFPNPSGGEVYVKAGDITEEANISVFNIQGSLVYSKDLQPQNGTVFYTFNLGNNPAGVYFIKFRTKSGVKVEKLQLQ